MASQPDPIAVILLAGSVSAARFSSAAERSLPELPLAEGVRVWDLWVDAMGSWAVERGWGRLAVRVVVDHDTPVSLGREVRGPVEAEVERDPEQKRGLGGLLRDLVKGYGDEDRVLVVFGSQLPPESLSAAAGQLIRTGADVAMACDTRGVPAGLMLVRCGCLRGVKEVGYADFNEQVLPVLTKRFDVRSVTLDQATGQSVRTPVSYLSAVEAYKTRQRGEGGRGVDEADAFAEWGRELFRVVEPGAEVAGDAIVRDSVVLAGGVVQGGAVVVRSVVCPGGRVGAGEQVRDAVVTAAGVQSAADLAAKEGPPVPVPRRSGGMSGMTLPWQLRTLGWSGWTLPLAGGLMLAMAGTMWEGWAEIYRIASTQERGRHVFLVPWLAVVVASFRVRRLQMCPIRGPGVGVAMVVGGVLGYRLGWSWNIEVLMTGGTVLATIGAAVVVLGRSVLVQLLPAFAMLALMMPMPGRFFRIVHRPVTRLVEMVTQEIYSMAGLPVTVDGSVAGATEAWIRVGPTLSTFFLLTAMILVGYTYLFGLPFKAWARVAGLIVTVGISLVVLITGAAASLWAIALVPAELASPLATLAIVAMMLSTWGALYLLTKWLDWAYVPLRPYRLAYQG